MKRLRIVVSGRVQRVGYRDRVAEIARKIGVKGTVRNLDDDISIEIIVEGEEKLIQEFLKSINIQDKPIEVEKVEPREETTIEKFKHFKILRGEGYEELGERMDVAAGLLYGIDKKQDQMLGKQDQMLGKQDQMIEKQDQMITKQDQMIEKQDQMLGKQDQMITKQDQMIEKQDQMLDEQRRTTAVLKETNQKLNTVEEKYGKVSERLGKLESIDAHLKELVEILRAFKPQ